jgi:hypothetical protein
MCWREAGKIYEMTIHSDNSLSAFYAIWIPDILPLLGGKSGLGIKIANFGAT